MVASTSWKDTASGPGQAETYHVTHSSWRYRILFDAAAHTLLTEAHTRVARQHFARSRNRHGYVRGYAPSRSKLDAHLSREATISLESHHSKPCATSYRTVVMHTLRLDDHRRRRSFWHPSALRSLCQRLLLLLVVFVPFLRDVVVACGLASRVPLDQDQSACDSPMNSHPFSRT